MTLTHLLTHSCSTINSHKIEFLFTIRNFWNLSLLQEFSVLENWIELKLVRFVMEYAEAFEQCWAMLSISYEKTWYFPRTRLTIQPADLSFSENSQIFSAIYHCNYKNACFLMRKKKRCAFWGSQLRSSNSNCRKTHALDTFDSGRKRVPIDNCPK